jgi:hypothetical protein
MLNCRCYTTSLGEVIVCDSCASEMIEAINGLVTDNATEQLPVALTAGEYSGLKSAVNGYFNSLRPQEGGAR